MSEIVTIIDHIGRTVVGVEKGSTKSTLTLFNPVILHIQPDPETNQLQVQSYPYVFMELLEDKDKNNWTFDRSSIVMSDAKLSDQVIQQYHGINSPPDSAAAAGSEPEVVKLFDESADK
jgi:hypothetical protein